MKKMTFDHFAARASDAMGSFRGFCAMLGFTLACMLLGPWLGWMMTQIILTTTLTVITQLCAMLIQRSQDRSEKAIQIKLDELIKAIDGADNQLRGIENEGLGGGGDI